MSFIKSNTRLVDSGLFRVLLTCLAVFVVTHGFASASASDIEVGILEPSPFVAVYGEVEVVVDADAGRSEEAISSVEIYVDGVRVAVLDRPPYKFTVDVGEDNIAHVFRAVARTASGATGEMSLETPAIEVQDSVDLALKQLFVTVSDGSSVAEGLTQSQFRILDDGVSQEIVTFEDGNAPLTAVMLVDSSQSMQGGRLQTALDGASAFLEGMRELDEAKVMLFSDRLLWSTPFAGDAGSLRESLRGAQAEGGTALNDHLYAALKILDGRQGRRVIVLLSDGSDVHSLLDMEDVLWKVRRSQAMVYWIRLDEGAGAGISSSWRDVDASRKELDSLAQATRNSGARILSVTSISQVRDAFASILKELREQYVVGFYPNNIRKDGAWHKLNVKVAGGYDVRARNGYIDQ